MGEERLPSLFFPFGKKSFCDSQTCMLSSEEKCAWSTRGQAFVIGFFVLLCFVLFRPANVDAVVSGSKTENVTYLWNI